VGKFIAGLVVGAVAVVAAYKSKLVDEIAEEVQKRLYENESNLEAESESDDL